MATPQRSLLTRSVAIVSALALTAAVMIGYSYLRWRHAQRVLAEEAAKTKIPPPAPSPQAQLFVDDALIRGSKAVIGGTVLNISSTKLSDLNVELELKRRKDGKSEFRVVAIEPRDLEPNGQGRFSLDVPSSEFRESHVRQLKTGPTGTEVPFKVVPGAKRPNEPPAEGKIIIVKPSPRRGNGEEFINTPETPVKVP